MIKEALKAPKHIRIQRKEEQNDERIQKPVVELAEGLSEGIYAASGDEEQETTKDHPEVCKYGRREANPGVDMCQACSATNGLSSDGSGYFREDFAGCPENMPIKNN